MRLLHDPKDGQMVVAALMSGAGTNLRRLLEYQQQLEIERGQSPYRIAVIFTDNPKSSAVQIGKEYGLPVIVRDIDAFYAAHGKNKGDLVRSNFSPEEVALREQFDREAVQACEPYQAKFAVFCGHDSVVTDPWLKRYCGINVHSADLSIVENGKRKYTGNHAVRDAILTGKKFLRSTTHIVTPEVDGGGILMISAPLEVILADDFDPKDPKSVRDAVDLNKNRLKEVGDWIIFRKTALYTAEGRYAMDDNGNLYFDNKPIPTGVRL